MSSNKVPRSREDLVEKLNDQIRFLMASADAYDQGFEGEAQRLAVTLRILFHNSRNCHSLLGQLGELDRTFLSTCFEFDPANIASHGGLTFLAQSGGGAKFIAMLDDVPLKRELSFEDWWNEVVFVGSLPQPLDEQVEQKPDNRPNLPSRHQFTRQLLVRTVADQDGGAHIDPSLDAQYDLLIKGEYLGWHSVGPNGDKLITRPERAAIRQIAHEALVSLVPGYQKKPQIQADVIVGGMSIVQGIPPWAMTSAVPQPNIFRKSPCICGSGRKYKRCCGK